ncbi:MAG: hypothetical protein R2708_26935 [Vicinamibacterales bacterium]
MFVATWLAGCTETGSGGTAPAAADARSPADRPAGPPGEADAVPIVTLTLTPVVASGATAPVAAQVPRRTAQVRFLLVGDLPPADALTAEISAVGRDEVRRWPVDDAPTGTGEASRAVTVPVYAVPAGDYALTLWAGDADLVQRYGFRVVTP